MTSAWLGGADVQSAFPFLPFEAVVVETETRPADRAAATAAVITRCFRGQWAEDDRA